VPELNVADLVVALVIVYGAAVIAVVFGFMRAVTSRRRSTPGAFRKAESVTRAKQRSVLR
jgi:hypothetical protein